MKIETSVGYVKGRASVAFVAETSAEAAQLRELTKNWDDNKIPYNIWENLDGERGISLRIALNN